MSQPFDFFKFSCGGSGEDRCDICPRNFVIQSSMIIGVFEAQSGKAIISISPTYFFPHPKCSERLRMIETQQDFDSVIEILDGSLFDFGSIAPVNYKDS